MRLLVTGKTGQVATALLEQAAQGDVEVVAVGRPEFDLVDPTRGFDLIAAARPDVIVSAAAYTAVDQAEGDEAAANLVNGTAPGVLAQWARDLDIPIVHLSTDYVFDGRKPEPYDEQDQTNPLGAYGRSKLLGETAVAAGTPNHAILRTAWVYSPFGKNFLKTMLRLGADRPVVRVVADQIGNPTAAIDIAHAIVAVSRNLLDQPLAPALRGIFHLTASGEASWAEFASEIFAGSRALGGPAPDVVAISTSEYPTPAARPANSRLSGTKLADRHHIVLPQWRNSTRQTLERLLAN